MIPVKDSGRNNVISCPDSVSWTEGRVPITIGGDDNTVIIEDNVILGNSLINIVGSGCSLRLSRHARFVQAAFVLNDGGAISIGEKTVWGGGTMRAEHGGRITVGRDCLFSANIGIRTSDGHAIFDMLTLERINPPADVVIEDHVWLGHSTTVGKGCHIGRGTVLGQLSYASGRLDPHCIYAGVPARKIKEGIVWSQSLHYETILPEYRHPLPD